MSERFLKFIPSKEAMWLLKSKGNAFRLLSIIAEAARRYEGDPDGLKIGECFIGGFENYDMSEQNYRTAKRLLEVRGHIKIVETCRTRKKCLTTKDYFNSTNCKNPTTGLTTNSTKVKLLSSTVWDINSDEGNDRTNDRLTTDQRPPNDKLRKRRIDISNDISSNALRDEAHPASPIRSKDSLSFDFEKWEFKGINEKDHSEWKIMYPHIDIPIEMLKVVQWLKTNPSKNNKKHWRKFLAGWFGRSNDSLENKKAFRAASGGIGTDRRTKNMDGTPIKSRAEDLF